MADIGEIIDINIPKLPKGAAAGVVAIVVVIILVIWVLFQGPFYTVGADEEGVIQTFGKYTSSTGPGFHFKWPWPIQTVMTPKVTEAKRIEVGFRTIDPGPPAKYRNILSEAKMLTGDENIVLCDMIVQYKIKSAEDFLFNVKDVEGTLHDLAESALRSVIGDRIIDDALTVKKEQIQDEIEQMLQDLVDNYRMGILIRQVQLQDVRPPEQVDQAFKEVATAREEKQQVINEAEGYQNEKIPAARGEAAALIAGAEGDRAARIAEAEGDVARFLAVAEEYKKAPDVTKKRLYLETMSEILPNMDKVIIDSDSPVLNINDLTRMGIGSK